MRLVRAVGRRGGRPSAGQARGSGVRKSVTNRRVGPRAVSSPGGAGATSAALIFCRWGAELPGESTGRAVERGNNARVPASRPRASFERVR